MAEHPEQVEVEIKAHVDDLGGLRSRLLERGATPVKTVHQRDHYLAHPSRSFEETDEALRVRIEDDGAFLTYKGPKLDDSTKTRQELEVPIDDANIVLSMFESLGFTPVPVVEKHREVLAWVGVIVTLDEVEDVGTFVEIEHEPSNGGIGEAQERVLSLASDLGLDRLERRSYLEMLLEREDPGRQA